jgi:hypothetical protein
MLCEVCIFLHYSDTGIVASDLTWSVDMCVCIFMRLCFRVSVETLGWAYSPPKDRQQISATNFTLLFIKGSYKTNRHFQCCIEMKLLMI